MKIKNMKIVDSTKPRIFIFDPHDWGEVWYVLAFSKTQALDCLKKYMETKTHGKYKLGLDLYNKWKDVNVNTLPEKYKIIEKQPFEVIESDYS